MSLDDMLGAKPDPNDPNQPAADKADTEGPPPQRLQMLGLSQIRDLKPAVPIIEGLIYRDTLVQLAGNPGSFKSFITIGQACAVASGQTSWEGHRIKHHGPVIYIAAEGVHGIWLRAAAWCHITGVDPSVLDGKLFVINGAAQMGNILDMDELLEKVQDVGAVLVIWDTRARCTTGLEENSSTEQGRAITEGADRIRAATGATQFLVHHTTKSGVGGGRGSNAWDGAVWSDLRLRKEGMTAVITCEKHKDIPAGCEHRYDMKLVTAPIAAMPGATEEQRTTLVATVADERGPAGGGSMMTITEEKVIKVLDDTAGPEGISKSQTIAFMEEQGAGAGKSAIYNALKSLEAKGRIRCVNPGSKIPKFTTQPELTLDAEGNSP